MSKHENHTGWNMYECTCCGTDYEEMANNLHQDYIQLKSTVLDLLQSLDAEDQLKNGFNGMGHNIMTETASRKRMHVRRLRSMIGEDQG